MTMWTETIPVAEAAEKLLAFVREIRDLDAKFIAINDRKAAIYREAKATGFNKLAVKQTANDPSLDDDTKALRKYLELLCGPEAASAMKDENDFGRVLFGAEDSWPTTYADPRHGFKDTPAE
jgi:uncharacterized protein (UPF0335 family)